jgi:hypothetical protein
MVGHAAGKPRASSRSHVEHLATDTTMDSSDDYARGLSARTSQLAGRILAQVNDPAV